MLLKLIVCNTFSLWVWADRIEKQMLICSLCWKCLMLEETLDFRETAGFPISHLPGGGHVLCGFLSWNIWKMNTWPQELTSLAAMSVIILLPYQLSWKFPGGRTSSHPRPLRSVHTSAAVFHDLPWNFSFSQSFWKRKKDRNTVQELMLFQNSALIVSAWQIYYLPFFHIFPSPTPTRCIYSCARSHSTTFLPSWHLSWAGRKTTKSKRATLCSLVMRKELACRVNDLCSQGRPSLLKWH